MPFLYGNHVVKAHLGRITEDTPEHQGVVVFSMSDVPLVRVLSRAICISPAEEETGLWRDCTVNRRYTKIGSNSNHCISSGVRPVSIVTGLSADTLVLSDVGEYLRDEVRTIRVSCAPAPPDFVSLQGHALLTSLFADSSFERHLRDEMNRSRCIYCSPLANTNIE
jgi:hypothetical protein